MSGSAEETGETGLRLLIWEIRTLLARYDFEKLPRRIRKALRHFLYACFTYELEIRFTLVVTGLEALVNAHKRDVTKQFKRRLNLVGADLGIAITEDEAKEAYDYRSNFGAWAVAARPRHQRKGTRQLHPPGNPAPHDGEAMYRRCTVC